jgi:cell division protein FtsB
MLTREESALLLDFNQRLRKLHVEKANAQNQQNRARAAALQAEIDELTEDCDKVLEIADTD